MYNEKKRVIRFVKGLPAEFSQEEIINELIKKDLGERGITPEQFEMERQQIARVLDGPDVKLKPFFN